MYFLSADQDLTRHSYYADTAVREAPHPALQGDASCDVAIVGVRFVIERDHHLHWPEDLVARQREAGLFLVIFHNAQLYQLIIAGHCLAGASFA